MALRIRGGISGAGSRQPPYEVPKVPWWCSRGHENKGNHTRCFTLGCNERRPAASDCATNNEPAFPPGPCDCKAAA